MEATATINFEGLPITWNSSRVFGGVWSEFGFFCSDTTPGSHSITIPTAGRFIRREWKFVFLADDLAKRLLIWKGGPVDGKTLFYADGREIPFRLLSKWGWEEEAEQDVHGNTH